MENPTSQKKTDRLFTEQELQQSISAVTAQYREEINKYREAYAFKRLDYLFQILSTFNHFTPAFVAKVVAEIEETLTLQETDEDGQ